MIPDTGGAHPAQESLLESATELVRLRDALLAAEAEAADRIAAVHPVHRRSATNLVHYIELRNHDIRGLQRQLSELGLSSLGRCEPHVLASVEAVLAVTQALLGVDAVEQRAPISIGEGRDLLDTRTDGILGPRPAGRATRIMVTLPDAAAHDELLLDQMAAAGMDIARINCAHDTPVDWAKMIGGLRQLAVAGGHSIRVAMDLAGPKLRTGPIVPAPGVLRIAPDRDRRGHIQRPALVWLVADEADVIDAPCIRIADGKWLARRTPGDVIEVADARGKRRRWEVVEVVGSACLVSTTKTTYVETGTKFRCRIKGRADVASTGPIPSTEQWHRVKSGDAVVLTRTQLHPVPPAGGRVHRIGCSLPEFFDAAGNGDRVWFDDGKFGGIVDGASHDEVRVTMTDVPPGGAKLKAGKGINVPDTELRIAALTDKDIDDLELIGPMADIVSLSFVRRPADVEQFQAELERIGARGVGIVLKIETAEAFRNLPQLLLTAMRSEYVGVMIARGDLAVEVGFDRLAEVQEEILWASEAAHVPVIWATQVLESLAKKGRPSRAEITDAAMAERAECVMLNKGPHIVEAIDSLDSILRRMNEHQDKKRSLLRRLTAWDGTGAVAPVPVLAQRC